MLSVKSFSCWQRGACSQSGSLRSGLFWALSSCNRFYILLNKRKILMTVDNMLEEKNQKYIQAFIYIIQVLCFISKQLHPGKTTAQTPRITLTHLTTTTGFLPASGHSDQTVPLLGMSAARRGHMFQQAQMLACARRSFCMSASTSLSLQGQTDTKLFRTLNRLRGRSTKPTEDDAHCVWNDLLSAPKVRVCVRAVVGGGGGILLLCCSDAQPCRMTHERQRWWGCKQGAGWCWPNLHLIIQ